MKDQVYEHQAQDLWPSSLSRIKIFKSFFNSSTIFISSSLLSSQVLQSALPSMFSNPAKTCEIYHFILIIKFDMLTVWLLANRSIWEYASVEF